MVPIQFTLIEQDFCMRINHGMTITDRRKADCFALAQQYGLITPQVNAQGKPAKATKPRLREALVEVVYNLTANFGDEYKPSHGVVEALGSQEAFDSIRAEATSVRLALGIGEEEDDYTCEFGNCHADDPCSCQ